MAEDFTPRNYQIELMEIGLKQNTIMFLPTGSGKTFISLLVLKNMSKSLLRSYGNGGKITIILVNTVALVDQHQKYILDHTNLRVGQYSGEMNVDSWTRNKWYNEFNNYQVIIMTSQILVNLFNNNYIDLNKVNLLIFDECHRGVNDHSMRQLMKFFENLREPPRVIGLTATLLNGSCKPQKVIETVLALETTFHSKVATVDGLAQVVGYSTNPSEHLKQCETHILESHEQLAVKFLRNTVAVLKILNIDQSASTAPPLDLKGLRPLSVSTGRKDLSNMLQDLAMHVETMGSYGALKAAVSHSIQIERMKKHCDQLAFLRVLEFVQTSLTFVKETLSNAMLDFDEAEQIFMFSSAKMLALLEIFQEYASESTEKLCCIVFTKRRFTAKVIYHVLQSLAERHKGYGHLRPEYIVGCSNNPFNDTRENLFGAKRNKRVLEGFCNKEFNVLVASDVLEEGVDIPKCTLVVKYDKPEDYRSYIQSKGRARHRTSLYYIILEEGAMEKYGVKYANFQRVEGVLNDYLIGKNLDRPEPSREDIEKMYKEDELPPYFADGQGTAQVTMTSAIPLLCQYCNSLPSDMYTVHAPEWYVKKSHENAEEGENSHGVVIMLPTVCPIAELLKPIEGPFMRTVKVAKRAAALQACEALHKAGELDDDLKPRKRGAKEEDVKFLFAHYPAVRERGAGGAKRRRLHKRHITRYNRGQLKQHSECYLHVIRLEPQFERPADTNGSAFYDLYTSPLCYGILTPSPLPTLCDFPLYTATGTVNVSLKVNQKKMTFTREEIEHLRKFQIRLFGEVLRTLRPFLVFDNAEDAETLMVVPVDRVTLDVDSEALLHARVAKVAEPTEDEKLKSLAAPGELLGEIVAPWYREPTYYLVTEVCRDKNASSPFPSENYSSFADYFAKHRGLRLLDPDSPLLAVRGLTKRLNFFRPRGREAKRTREHRHEDTVEYLLPEIVVKQDFPAALWVQASFLPGIVTRIQSLLQAEELRLTVCKEAGIGEETVASRNPLRLDAYLLDYEAFVEDDKEHPDVKFADDTVVGAPETRTRSKKSETLEELYPWMDADEPKDVERDLTATVDDVERFEAFVCTPVENKKRVNQEFLQRRPQQREELARVDIYSYKPIQILEPPSSDAGPELSELYKALTTAKANDIVNLERLETLGDSFLKLTASVYIALRFPLYDEGRATDLKGRLVSNKNLYYLAVSKGLNGMIRYQELSPKGNWVPPGFSVPEEMRRRIERREMSVKVLERARFEYDEQVSGEVSEKSLSNLVNGDCPPSGEDEEHYQSLGPFLNSQYVGDKYVADVVEALLGAYLSASGFQGGIKFMEWVGIIPPSENLANLLKQPPPDPVLNKTSTSENVDYHIPHWEEIEKIVGYKFKNRAYLLQALTHASYTPNRVTRSYEKLEFLGDAVLDFLITCYIYESFGHLNPGQLTDLRSALVNNNTFACLVVRNGLHKFLLMINSKLQGLIDKFVALVEKKDYEVDDEILILLEDEEYRLGETVDVPKVLGDIFEAMAGAIYLDCDKNLETVWAVFHKLMYKEIIQFGQNVPMNVIRRLFEWDKADPKFGSVHYLRNNNKSMVPLRFMLNGVPKYVYGVGTNKTMAKKAAAKMAIRFLSN